MVINGLKLLNNQLFSTAKKLDKQHVIKSKEDLDKLKISLEKNTKKLEDSIKIKEKKNNELEYIISKFEKSDSSKLTKELVALKSEHQRNTLVLKKFLSQREAFKDPKKVEQLMNEIKKEIKVLNEMTDSEINKPSDPKLLVQIEQYKVRVKSLQRDIESITKERNMAENEYNIAQREIQDRQREYYQLLTAATQENQRLLNEGRELHNVASKLYEDYQQLREVENPFGPLHRGRFNFRVDLSRTVYEPTYNGKRVKVELMNPKGPPGRRLRRR